MAFYYCQSLSNITIPNNVTTIEGQAFDGTSLTSITIPASVTSIDYTAFLELLQSDRDNGGYEQLLL